MYKQLRQRLAIGLTGTVMAGALLIGALPVAADDSAAEVRDVNVGAEATGLVGLPIFTTNNAVLPATVNADITAAPSGGFWVVGNRDDRSADGTDG
jgi:hypothetical protein